MRGFPYYSAIMLSAFVNKSRKFIPAAQYKKQNRHTQPSHFVLYLFYIMVYGRVPVMYQMGDSKLEVRELLVKAFARQAGCIIAVTGAIDLVSDGERCWCIRNGRPEMGQITGTGCQLSGMMTAFVAANPDNQLEAAAAAVCMMGLAGEIGWSRMAEGDGNATYRNRIIDAIYNMDGETLNGGAKYEVR